MSDLDTIKNESAPEVPLTNLDERFSSRFGGASTSRTMLVVLVCFLLGIILGVVFFAGILQGLIDFNPQTLKSFLKSMTGR
jgi:hypothetical protein